MSTKRERELLGLDPSGMTEEELETAIGDCNRIVDQLQEDQSSARKVDQGLGQRVSPIRQARNQFRQELSQRG